MKFKTDIVRKAVSKKLPRRKVKNAVTRVFGFDVVLPKAEQIRFEGEWVLNVDYQELADQLTIQLLEAHRPLTGAQLKFLRKHLKLTQDELGRRVGKEQPHIARAENKGNKPAFENYADQFTLISHLKVAKVRKMKEDADWIEDVFSAEDFESAPLAKVTLKSA